MKSQKLLLLVFIVLVSISVHAQEINWLKNYKEASALARQTGKPLLLDFTASWCKPCQAMERTFWVRPDMIELSGQFVCVKINFDTERSLRSKYGITGIPNVVFTDSWGLALLSNKGFGSESDDAIFRKISYVPTNFSEIKEAGNLLEDDKNNIAALYKVGDFYHDRKFYFQSIDFYKRIEKLEAKPAERESLILRIGFNYLRSNAPDEALEIFEDFRKEFPQSTQTDGIIYGQIYAYHKKNKLKDAQKLFAQLKSAYPNSDRIAEAEKLLAQPSEKK